MPTFGITICAFKKYTSRDIAQWFRYNASSPLQTLQQGIANNDSALEMMLNTEQEGIGMCSI